MVKVMSSLSFDTVTAFQRRLSKMAFNFDFICNGNIKLWSSVWKENVILINFIPCDLYVSIGFKTTDGSKFKIVKF